MNFEERMIELMGPLVGGNAFWDQTPDKVPAGDYIIMSHAGGRAGWYVEQTVPDAAHERVQITAFSDRSNQRSLLARRIEFVMCAADFEACEPYGRWRGFSEPTRKKYAALWQFGVWYKPDVL